MVDTEVGPVDDETAETKVDFSPPRGTSRMPDDRPIITGAIGAEADKRDPGLTSRFGSLGGAKPKRPRFELPIPRTPGPRRMPPGAGTQPEQSGTDRFSFEMPTPTYPGPGRQPAGAGTRSVTDRYTFGMLTLTYPDRPNNHRIPKHNSHNRRQTGSLRNYRRRLGHDRGSTGYGPRGEGGGHSHICPVQVCAAVKTPFLT